eukprot:PhM_4_TR7662/c0_g2_i1/m.63323
MAQKNPILLQPLLQILLFLCVVVACAATTTSAPTTSTSTTSSDVFGKIAGIPRDTLRKSPIRVMITSFENNNHNNKNNLTPITESTYVHVSDFTFGFFALPPGSYTLEIASASHIFPTLRVDVSKKHDNRVRVTLHDGSKQNIATTNGNSFVIEPIGAAQYYHVREGINPMNLLKNPIVLMTVFGLGMTYIMPMLASEEELKKQMKDFQQLADQAQKPTAAAVQQRK